MLYNSDLRQGLEFNYNEETLLVLGVRLFTDFNAFQNYSMYSHMLIHYDHPKFSLSFVLFRGDKFDYTMLCMDVPHCKCNDFSNGRTDDMILTEL